MATTDITSSVAAQTKYVRYELAGKTAYGIVDKERRRRRTNRSAQQQIDYLYDQILQRTADELATLSGFAQYLGEDEGGPK